MHLFLLLVWQVSLYAADYCPQSCSLARDAEGQPTVDCRCQKLIREAKLWGRRDPATVKKILPLVRAGMAEASANDIEKAASNGCGGGERSADNKEELVIKARASGLPLCDCVRIRRHFSLKKYCWFAPSGETLCGYGLNQLLPAPGLRPATLNDYQACVARRLGYRPPESCATARCEPKRPACGPGTELFNIAGAEDCCPIFVCQPSLGDPHGK